MYVWAQAGAIYYKCRKLCRKATPLSGAGVSLLQGHSALHSSCLCHQMATAQTYKGSNMEKQHVCFFFFGGRRVSGDAALAADLIAALNSIQGG